MHERDNKSMKEDLERIIEALSKRDISLKKAAELMKMEQEVFLRILDNYGYEFSYLDETDIGIEKHNS